MKIAVGARLEILHNSSGSFSLRHKHSRAFPVCAYYRWCRDSCSEALRAVPTPRSQREAYKAECMRTARHFFIEAKLFTSSRIRYFEIRPLIHIHTVISRSKTDKADFWNNTLAGRIVHRFTSKCRRGEWQRRDQALKMCVWFRGSCDTRLLIRMQGNQNEESPKRSHRTKAKEQKPVRLLSA